MIDSIMCLVVVCCLSISAFIVHGNINKEKSEAIIKSSLYEECISTNYDKFQCYSMIYGDK